MRLLPKNLYYGLTNFFTFTRYLIYLSKKKNIIKKLSEFCAIELKQLKFTTSLQYF